MSKKLLIATSNQGKFTELSEPLKDYDFQVLSLADFPAVKEPEEPHDTYLMNSKAKADYYFDLFDVDYVLADDSGLEVEALKGELGVLTRRYGLGKDVSDQSWLDYFLETMSKFKSDLERRARFVSAISLKSKDDFVSFEGDSKGVIAKDVLAPLIPGIPLSSVFVPDGYKLPFAALTTAQKAEISHRGHALSKLIKYLQKNEFDRKKN